MIVYLLYFFQNSINTSYVAELDLATASLLSSGRRRRCSYFRSCTRPKFVVICNITIPPPLLFGDCNCVVGAMTLGRGIVGGGGGGSCRCCACFRRRRGGSSGRQAGVLLPHSLANNFLNSTVGKKEEEMQLENVARRGGSGQEAYVVLIDFSEIRG